MTRYQLVLLAAIILAALLTGFYAGRVSGHSTPRPANVIPASTIDVVTEPDHWQTEAPDSHASAMSRALPPGASPSPTATARPQPGLDLRATSSVSGIASWGMGWAGVVTRLPRGTAICVTGPISKWCGHSVGYGPQTVTGRIADLDMAVFLSICGPLSRGLCAVTLRW